MMFHAWTKRRDLAPEAVEPLARQEPKAAGPRARRARGWAHIGILRPLLAAGIVPDVIAGTSVGALVGGAWAADRLDALEKWAESITKRRVFSLLDFRLGASGLI